MAPIGALRVRAERPAAAVTPRRSSRRPRSPSPGRRGPAVATTAEKPSRKSAGGAASSSAKRVARHSVGAAHAATENARAIDTPGATLRTHGKLLASPTRAAESGDVEKRSPAVAVEDLALYRQPLLTLRYFALECAECFRAVRQWLLAHVPMAATVLAVVCVLVLGYVRPGAVGLHNQVRRLAAAGVGDVARPPNGCRPAAVQYAEAYVQGGELLLECLYWMWLGVLSSVGLGTGLHTFVLYLGPRIVGVTLHAWACGTTQISINESICPSGVDLQPVTMWGIYQLVCLPTLMWGIGTAIGELPPYILARSERLAHARNTTVDELQVVSEDGGHVVARLKRAILSIVLNAHFIGIVLFASVCRLGRAAPRLRCART